MSRYYGLDGHPALGDPLIESLLGKEVEWSLKVLKIILPEAPNDSDALVGLVPVQDLCKDIDCPDHINLKTFIHFSAGEFDDFISSAKEGDFIHVRGLLTELSEENYKGMGLFERTHIHVLKISYYSN